MKEAWLLFQIWETKYTIEKSVCSVHATLESAQRALENASTSYELQIRKFDVLNHERNPE